MYNLEQICRQYDYLSSVLDKMANFDERLFLQWNDFKENVSSTFGDLREDKDFTDVTLACEDGQQVEAHKVVLIASSPFFLNILTVSYTHLTLPTIYSV